MNYIVLLFGSLIVIGSVVLLIRPAAIFNLFAKHANSVWLHFFAVLVRIILGVALIIAASESRFPVVLQVLGWISILAALMLAVIGRVRFQNLIRWVLELAPPIKSVAGVAGIFFGAFLVYAVF